MTSEELDAELSKRFEKFIETVADEFGVLIVAANARWITDTHGCTVNDVHLRFTQLTLPEKKEPK